MISIEWVCCFPFLQFYLKDLFGMKSLNAASKLHVHEVAGVQHVHWHRNESVFRDCIEMYLK